MFNPLEINTNDVNQLFDISATNILINDKPTKAIVTNINLMTSNEDRNLHTLDKVSQGDVVTYQDEYYLIVTETITKRHSKYKTLMRHCNHSLPLPPKKVQVGVDDYGRPRYEYIDQGSTPAIVSNQQSYKIEEGASVRVGYDQIVILITDNEVNREEFIVNGRFNLLEKEYRILDVNFTQKGLIKLTCEQR